MNTPKVQDKRTPQLVNPLEEMVSGYITSGTTCTFWKTKLSVEVEQLMRLKTTHGFERCFGKCKRICIHKYRFLLPGSLMLVEISAISRLQMVFFLLLSETSVPLPAL